MSKGPGRCQRNIIAALDVQPAVELDNLLGESFTRPQRVALYRAARMLESKGQIGVVDIWDPAQGKRVYLLHRQSYDIQAHSRAHGLTWHPGGCAAFYRYLSERRRAYAFSGTPLLCRLPFLNRPVILFRQPCLGTRLDLKRVALVVIAFPASPEMASRPKFSGLASRLRSVVKGEVDA